MLTAVLAALASAALFGVASALQHEQAGQVGSDRSPGLLVTLAQRPRWLAGIVADVVAVALQALALGLGTVALVQPLLVGGLPVAVALSARLHARRLGAAEITGVLLTTVGLVLLAPATATTTSDVPPGRRAALLAGVVVAGVVGGLLLAARRRGWGPAAAGLAAGVTTGAGSVLLAVSAGRADHPAALLRSAAPYAAVLVGLLGLLLAQSAFQTGGLGAPLAALSLSEPVTAVLLACLVLHERLPGTPLALAELVAGSVLAVAGVLLLCLHHSDPLA